MRRLAVLFTISAALALAGCYQTAHNEIDNLGDEPGDPDGDVDSDADGDADGDSGCLGIPCLDDGAPVIHVDGAVASGGDGLSWETAIDSIHQGLDTAHCLAQECGAPAQVWVAEGTHYVFADGPDDAVLLRPGVELYGGFAGDEQVLADRTLGEHVTILDGRAGPDSEQRVLHVVVGSDEALIDGFTITGGRAEGTGPYGSCGGGLLAVLASPIVRYVTFLDNAAGDCGGGGMYVRDGAPIVSGCVLLSNTTTAGSGAGIHIDNGAPAISTTVFLGNDAAGDGGGLAAHGGTVLVERSSFVDNRTDGFGGAVLGVDDSRIELRGCEISGNTAEGGGAISTGQAELEVINSLFYDNSAYWGGAIYILDNHLTELTNCTFTDNYAEEEGGALLQMNGGNEGTTAVVGGIFWDDSPDEIVLYGATPQSAEVEIAFNDIAGGGFDADPGNIDADPLFADSAEGDFSLIAYSPCIDRADDAAAPSTDMLGHERVEVLGAGNDGTVADMGALEYQL